MVLVLSLLLRIILHPGPSCDTSAIEWNPGRLRRLRQSDRLIKAILAIEVDQKIGNFADIET